MNNYNKEKAEQCANSADAFIEMAKNQEISEEGQRKNLNFARHYTELARVYTELCKEEKQ